MKGRWLLTLGGLTLGLLTALALVVAALYAVTLGSGSGNAGPRRWQPITPTPTQPPTPTVAPQTPTPQPPGIHVGGQAQVVSAVGVRLRKTPGYRNKPPEDVLTVVPSRSVVTVIGGPEEVDGLRWWRVRWRGYEGWMAEATAQGLQLLAPVPSP